MYPRGPQVLEEDEEDDEEEEDEEEEEEEEGVGGQRTAVGLPPWTSVPNIISSCEDPSYFAIVPNLEVTLISVHSVLPLILICFYFRMIVTTT